MDLTSRNDSEAFLTALQRDIQQGPWGKQLAYGVAGGCLSGFVCARVGRSASLGLGTSVLFLQVASQMGWIRIDWSRVQRDISTRSSILSDEDSIEAADTFVRKLRCFIANNLLVATGFTGGFFLGLGTG